MSLNLLQVIKDKKLSALQLEESERAFEIVTRSFRDHRHSSRSNSRGRQRVEEEDVEEEVMDAYHLKLCLKGLSMPITLEEAKAFIYELDYNDTHTIGLVDFQRIYLYKSLQKRQSTIVDECFHLLDPSNSGQISLQDLQEFLTEECMELQQNMDHNTPMRLRDLRRLLDPQGIFPRLIQQHLKDHQLFLSPPPSPGRQGQGQRQEEDSNKSVYLTKHQLASFLF